MIPRLRTADEKIEQISEPQSALCASNSPEIFHTERGEKRNRTGGTNGQGDAY
jgi:hypothetical protein